MAKGIRDHGKLVPGTPPINPTGKGGFGDRPQDINRKGRPKNRGSMTGSLRHYMQMTTSEITSLIADVEAGEVEMTEAEAQALRQVIDGRGAGKDAHMAREQIMDRLDGKPRITVDASLSTPEPPHINITFA